MALKTTPFDAADHLPTVEACGFFLTEAFTSDDAAHIAHALGIVARARGLAKVAKKAGLSRERLRNSLSVKGNPDLATFLKVLKAAGLELVAQPAEKPKRQAGPKISTTRRKIAQTIR